MSHNHLKPNLMKMEKEEVVRWTLSLNHLQGYHFSLGDCTVKLKAGTELDGEPVVAGAVPCLSSLVLGKLKLEVPEFPNTLAEPVFEEPWSAVELKVGNDGFVERELAKVKPIPCVDVRPNKLLGVSGVIDEAACELGTPNGSDFGVAKLGVMRGVPKLKTVSEDWAATLLPVVNDEDLLSRASVLGETDGKDGPPLVIPEGNLIPDKSPSAGLTIGAADCLPTPDIALANTRLGPAPGRPVLSLATRLADGLSGPAKGREVTTGDPPL